MTAMYVQLFQQKAFRIVMGSEGGFFYGLCWFCCLGIDGIVDLSYLGEKISLAMLNKLYYHYT